MVSPEKLLVSMNDVQTRYCKISNTLGLQNGKICTAFDTSIRLYQNFYETLQLKENRKQCLNEITSD